MANSKTANSPGPCYSRLTRALLLVLVASYCVWVFSLPLFPTQDGAIHLYYTQVLSHLLSGSSLYAQYFAIRHPIPPYVSHYALLLGLTRLFQPLLAEKCVVCLIIAGFVYGFRALAGQVGPAADIVALWVLPLSLNWMLGMGFHNFCLSMSLGLWTMAAWLRAAKTRSFPAWALYFLLLVLVLFTHPVPLLLTVVFVASEVLLRMTQVSTSEIEKQECFKERLYRVRADILFASLSFLPLAYIAFFVRHHSTANDLPGRTLQFKILLSYASLKTLSLIGKTQAGYVYRLTFYIILFCAVAIALRGFRQRWSMRRLQVSDLMLSISLALGIIIPLFPRSMAGSDYFADRLIVYIWITALAAAACRPLKPVTFRPLLSAAPFLFSLGALLLTDRHIRPVASQVALLESVHTSAPGVLGLFFESPSSPRTSMVSFDPYVWAPARYFRQTDSIMLNAPWLNLPILPLEPRGEEFAIEFKDTNNYPDRLRNLFVHSKTASASIAGLPEFVLAEEGPESADPDPLITDLWPQRRCERINWASIVCQVVGVQTGFPVTTAKAISTKRT